MTERFDEKDRGSEETSLSILERAQSNDPDAWRILVDLYAPVVFSRCRKYWRMAPSNAENVGQEVFIAVARKLPEFKRKRCGSFRRWLRTITDNKCKDNLAGKQLASAKGGSSAKMELEQFQDPIDDYPDPNQQLDEKTLIVRQAIKLIQNEFSIRDLEIFWSIAIDENHRQHVAAAFNVSDNVVYLAYSRIKKRVRDVCQELLDDDLM